MSDLLRPCVECGEITEDSRCPEHQLKRTPKTITARKAGYDSTWDRLSKRARKLQPFCTDCGVEEDLTTDHSPEAWQRKREGKPITLELVEVVCRPCNSRRGSARSLKTWGQGVNPPHSEPRR